MKAGHYTKPGFESSTKNLLKPGARSADVTSTASEDLNFVFQVIYVAVTPGTKTIVVFWKTTLLARTPNNWITEFQIES